MFTGLQKIFIYDKVFVSVIQSLKIVFSKMPISRHFESPLKITTFLKKGIFPWKWQGTAS